MKSCESDPTPVDAVPADRDETTGLPWFRTWRGVYLLVLASFILWVLLLLALTVGYS